MSLNEVYFGGVCDLSNADTALGIKTPYVGIEFSSIDEGRNYYEDYGKQEGCCIRTLTTTKGKWRSSDFTGAIFVCSKEGQCPKGSGDGEVNDELLRKESRTSSIVRMGCKAHMRISFNRFTGSWMVSKWNDNHNHKHVTPEKRRMMKSYRRLQFHVCWVRRVNKHQGSCFQGGSCSPYVSDVSDVFKAAAYR